jgi:hypothetical protein
MLKICAGARTQVRWLQARWKMPECIKFPQATSISGRRRVLRFERVLEHEACSTHYGFASRYWKLEGRAQGFADDALVMSVRKLDLVCATH